MASGIVRTDRGNGHSYTIDGTKVPGVTTVNGMRPKDALINWAGNTTAAYAVDYWEELAGLPPSQRLERLKRARFEDRDAGARRGTEVHALGASLVAGHEVYVPEALTGHVTAYLDFLDRLNPDPVLVETVIANRTVGYCGTFDLVADLLGHRWLLDLKTTRSGIFPDTALQLVAYARSEVYLDADGNEASMPELGIERVGAVWIRADGWELREVPLEHHEEIWTVFRHLAWLYRHAEGEREWIAPALEVTA